MLCHHVVLGTHAPLCGLRAKYGNPPISYGASHWLTSLQKRLLLTISVMLIVSLPLPSTALHGNERQQIHGRSKQLYYTHPTLTVRCHCLDDSLVSPCNEHPFSPSPLICRLQLQLLILTVVLFRPRYVAGRWALLFFLLLLPVTLLSFAAAGDVSCSLTFAELDDVNNTWWQILPSLATRSFQCHLPPASATVLQPAGHMSYQLYNCHTTLARRLYIHQHQHQPLQRSCVRLLPPASEDRRVPPSTVQNMTTTSSR